MTLLKTMTTITLIAAWTSGPAATTYDFESLMVNRVINGQDNWIDQPGQGQGSIYLDTTSNGTKVVRPVPTVAFNESAYLTRVNNANFTFAPFRSVQTDAMIQFDVNGEHIGLFALGRDLDGDRTLLTDPFGDGSGGEIGPAFGVDDRAFVVQQANQGLSYTAPFGSGNNGNDWYRLLLVIDFTAFDGQGSGSLFYMNLTDGDADFIPVTELQEIPLALDRMHPEAEADHWNALWLHLRASGGSRPLIDNLVPNAGPDPAIATCELQPDARVVARGGDLKLQAELRNHTVIKQNLIFATRFRLPSGAFYPAAGWLYGPVPVALGAAVEEELLITQRLPPKAPLGIYSYEARLFMRGAGLLDACRFWFRVVVDPAAPGK